MGVPYSISGCRHMLSSVEGIHRRGYHLVRIVPYLADSAGGGRWWCWLVPASWTSPDHGARFASPGPPPAELGYAFFPADARWRTFDYPATPDETAASILEEYPRLAAQGLGSDEAYVRWYSEMLRLTDPEGLVVGSAYYEGEEPTGGKGMRVIGGSHVADCVPPSPCRSD